MKVCDSDRSWLALGITDTVDLDREHAIPWSAHALRDLLLSCVRGLALINPRLRSEFALSALNLLRDIDLSVPTVVVLLPRAPLPEVSASQGEPVFAFLCTTAIFRSLCALMPEDSLTEDSLPYFCFTLLNAVINGRIHVKRIFVRQLPYWGKCAFSCRHSEPAAIIMAHRGKKQHLDTALHFIHCAGGVTPRIRVGLDVESPEDFISLLERYPEAEFYYAKPAPVGPYAIRQQLIAQSGEPLVILHDSDDISCYDRFITLQAEVGYADDHVMVGCHELMVDELRRQVWPIRYPLDVSRALKKEAGFAFLHATAIVGRSGFLSAGGLSTDRAIAYDTQFLLRASFKLRIRNVDEFLYIRRRHEGSLTVAKETADGIPLRRQLGDMWRADFKAIRRGEMTVEKSSLRLSLRVDGFEFRPLLSTTAGE